MGKQRTSRPQAFKATAAATSEIKAHVGEKNQKIVDVNKGNPSETHFAHGELAELLDSYSSNSRGVKTSKVISINGYPSLKLSGHSAVDQT